ncbi:MAG: hypothetical protein M3139_18000 [Bacteroidota bacterium]|nr:hypothetical protein [Bacteroidota bacterium]
MKKLFFLLIIISSCKSKSAEKIDNAHVEKLAEDFMRSKVIPKLKDPKPYEVTGAKVIVKRAADYINDYKFTYDHLSLNEMDSAENKRHLDSIVSVTKNLDSVISITVNVAYKTRYQRGDVVTDSIKLAYNPKDDKISLWPF